MGIIYGIKCIVTDKYYVGATTRFKKRKKEHFRSLRAGKHHSKKLQRAFFKYGEFNFNFIVLEECIEYTELALREQYWMDALTAYNKGYNSYKFSTPCPEGERNGMWGKPSPNKGKKSSQRKPVISYDLNTGEVQNYSYVTEVSTLLNIGPQFLGCITLDKIKNNGFCTFKNNFWFYADEFNLENLKDRFIIKYRPRSYKGKIRPQWHRDNISAGKKGKAFSEEHKENIRKANLALKRAKQVLRGDGKLFSSAVECAKFMSCDVSCISRVCSGKKKLFRGFSFNYINS